MTSSIGRILAIDDNASMLLTYRLLLEPLGFPFDTVASAADALAILGQHGDWDLILLDQKMQGDAGPDTGLDMMGELRLRAPSAKVIIVTGYAAPESVRRAFAAGAYDYLEKNSILDEILPVKVRNAMEAGRERRMAALSNGSRDAALHLMWNQLQSESDSHKKGKLLEDFVALLFKSVPGFERTETNLRLPAEEIDLVIPNESKDEYWRKESPYLIGECKNWTGKVDPKEFAHLWLKLDTKNHRAKVGFFVALNGFTKGFETFRQSLTKDDKLIVPIGRDELVEWLGSADKNATLKKFCKRATGLATVG